MKEIEDLYLMNKSLQAILNSKLQKVRRFTYNKISEKQNTLLKTHKSMYKKIKQSVAENIKYL